MDIAGCIWWIDASAFTSYEKGHARLLPMRPRRPDRDARRVHSPLCPRPLGSARLTTTTSRACCASRWPSKTRETTRSGGAGTSSPDPPDATAAAMSPAEWEQVVWTVGPDIGFESAVRSYWRYRVEPKGDFLHTRNTPHPTSGTAGRSPPFFETFPSRALRGGGPGTAVQRTASSNAGLPAFRQAKERCPSGGLFAILIYDARGVLPLRSAEAADVIPRPGPCPPVRAVSQASATAA